MNMKNTTFKSTPHWQAFLCLILMIGLVIPFSAVGAVDGQLDANNTATPPTINGSLSEAGWSLVTTAAKTTIGAPNNTVTFGAMWDSTNLYIGVRVLDANLFNDSANTWEDDSVEIYIDANHNHGTVYDSFDRQFVKGYNDTGLSSIGSTTGVTHAWAAITGGYSVELAIPWSNLGVTPTAGMMIGLDVGNNDDDNAGTRDAQAVWWGTVNNYNNTSAFGHLNLLGGGGATNTPTRTNTPLGPTFTPTRTATRTNTPLGPTATFTRTNTPTGSQSAYPSGVAWAIPGTIQAENFDLGGEAVAYHDMETANQGAQYRTTDGVDIEVTTDTGGGYNVGWTRTDEWMEYTVNVASAGNYTLTERVAAGVTTGSFRVEFNGVNVTGTVTVPNTGGWQTWANLNQTVSLSAGQQVMRIYFMGNDTNFNYISVTSGGGPTATPSVNRALNRPVTASSVLSSLYAAAYSVDGNQGSYWESTAGFPQTLTVDLGTNYTVSRVVLKLPAGWTSRTETLSILGSTDNISYTTIVGSAVYTIAPSANTVTINFSGTSRRYIRLNITANSGSGAAQISEFEVY